MQSGVLYIWLFLGVTRAVWGSSSCSYYYNIPRSPGGSCESQGGVDRDLEEKIWKLEGGIEGIKIIGKNSLDFVRTVQTTAGQFQASQQISDLDSLQRQIDGLKSVLTALPTGNQHPRAASPTLQKESAELSMAEWKLINITRELESNERSRSIVMSGMEQKLQAQEKKLTDLLNKIAILESNILSHHRGKRAATPPSQAVEISNMTSKAIDLRVEIRSIGNNEQKKLTELTKTIDGFKAPLADAKSDLQNLTSNLNGITNRLVKVVGDANQLQQTVQTVNRNLKPQLDQVKQDFRNLSEQIRNATSDYHTTLNDLAQKSRDVNKNTADLATFNFTKFHNDYNYLHMNVTVQHNDMNNLEKNPIVLIGKIDFDVKTFVFKSKGPVNQINRVLPILQRKFSTFQKPTTVAAG